MKKIDLNMIIILTILAIFIWTRDLHWMSSLEDTLPILIALPLFIWLGTPWEFRDEIIPPKRNLVITSIIFFLIGIVANFTTALTIGWVTLLWSWLSVRLIPRQVKTRIKLLILPLMAFPWVTLDAVTVGWWFRLSGAWMSAKILSIFGFDVVQEGTLMIVNGQSISVDVACAGLNTLQSMLISGSIVAYILLKNSVRFWWNLPLLVLLAWVANTLRIILISSAAVLVSPGFALGSFHTWGGWIILMFMFFICWIIFSFQQPNETSRS